MPARERYLPIADSERGPVEGARRVGAVAGDDLIDITVLLRSTSSSGKASAVETLGAKAPAERRHLSRAEFEALHGADQNDVATVEEFAADHGLTVSDVSLAKRTVKLAGTVAQLSKAFQVELGNYELADGTTYRGRTGAVNIPEKLAPIVQGIFGLDDRPQAVFHLRHHAARATTSRSRARSFLPTEVAELYRFPANVDGRGQTIAIIELGGGFLRSDLEQYFSELGVALPTVLAVSVDGSRNAPTGNPNGPDGEVMLDIEVIGAVAPGARIAVYFAPNTSQGFLNGILAAVHDHARHPSVISISWGGPESTWTKQSLRAMDEAFQAAALLGVTVCAASGDDGSSDGEHDGQAHVDFPASSPHVLACGGTRLVASNGSSSRETAWGGSRSRGATGGGISDIFALPDWQRAVNVPRSPNPGKHKGRGVPDVAGNADPASGYRIRVDGQEGVVGGTSAVAPLFAALVARINEGLGRPVGYLNPLIYRASDRRVFRDITTGSNGAFSAARGWDPCTGLGSPIGEELAAALATATSV